MQVDYLKMRNILIIITLLFPIQSLTQDVDLIITYYPNSDIIKESYSIIKSDTGKNVKNGEYKSFNKHSQIIEKGIYRYGEKTGVWETILRTKDGTITERFDYDMDIELEPIIAVPLSYPHSCRELSIEGQVIVNYQVNPDCSITNIKIIKSLHKDCDAEAIQSIKQMGILQEKYSIGSCKEQTIEKVFEFKME